MSRSKKVLTVCQPTFHGLRVMDLVIIDWEAWTKSGKRKSHSYFYKINPTFVPNTTDTYAVIFSYTQDKALDLFLNVMVPDLKLKVIYRSKVAINTVHKNESGSPNKRNTLIIFEKDE